MIDRAQFGEKVAGVMIEHFAGLAAEVVLPIAHDTLRRKLDRSSSPGRRPAVLAKSNRSTVSLIRSRSIGASVRSSISVLRAVTVSATIAS